MSLLELLLAENVTDFNGSRGERAKVDLFGADLAEKNLAGVDLSGADVDKADLTGSDLTGATLYKARMSGIDGTGMKLVEVLGAKVRLKEAYLDEADLTGADLSQGDLSEAVLTRSVGRGLKLTAAKLKDANCANVLWAGVDLSQSHITKADFTDADLSGADLSESTGAEVQFHGANLSGLRGSKARLPGCSFVGTNLAGAKLDAANLTDADFTGADLTDADLTGANLTNAKLVGAKLHGCILAEAGLEGVELAGLDLTGVDLTGIDPVLLGLSDAQRATLKVAGIPVNAEARLRPAKISAARNGDLIVSIWENDDGEGQTTVRYAVRTKDGEVQHGILPVTSASLLSRGAVAVGDGIDLVVLRERPAGIVVERFHVDPAGRVGAAVVTPLGYQPQVVPVLRPEGAGMRMWGLARRGPTLVVSSDGPDGLQPGASKAMPTALGFLGRHHPFLACKGGVVVPCTASGPGSPLRRPEGFPGKLASATPLGDRWFALWVEPPEGRNKGGIRGAWLGTRAAPEVEAITNFGAVLTLDCIEDGESLWMTWAELHGVGETRVFVQRVTEGFEEPAVQLPLDDVDELTFAPGPGRGLVIAVTTDEERTVFVDEQGDLLGVVEES